MIRDEKMNNKTSGSREPNPAAFNLSLHPLLNTYRLELLEVLHNEANFLPNSRVNVLAVSGPKSELAYHINQDDTQVKTIIDLRNVNDYSDSLEIAGIQNQGAHDSDSRQNLSSITRQLHHVSQSINTGLARSSAAVKVSTKLLKAHKQFCHHTARGLPGTAVSQTQAAIQYVYDSYIHQHSWLEQSKARKETAMNFVFNVVTQGDSTINLNTSYRMSQDSSSIHALTVLAMVFLPGTFTATLFSCVAFRTNDSGAAEVTRWLLPFPIRESEIGITRWL
ncbi:uncharacterized protein FRV6_13093 [Fusarium oxysporum]|uniref:Uncharacterized protein n=1 Tax=Fusarium oxysporum TaxID=5507 RepID=A0A2H3TMQ5_FUSOX|nr:uncharacterized protein FRV6_13093 [Fusarium oxysporum]